MDRYWLLTWHTYGTWLPGDPRGFVSPVRDDDGDLVLHNQPGTPCDADMPALEQSARDRMKGPPIYLTTEQAAVLLAQFQETGAYRGWELLAAAVMANHIHLVVGVPGDPDPEKILHSFKSYGSRALNQRWGKPPSESWWTESGSKRKKQGEAIKSAIQYVKDQPYALLIWASGAC